MWMETIYIVSSTHILSYTKYIRQLNKILSQKQLE